MHGSGFITHWWSKCELLHLSQEFRQFALKCKMHMSKPIKTWKLKFKQLSGESYQINLWKSAGTINRKIPLESNLTISSKVDCAHTISFFCLYQRSLNQITKETVMVNSTCQLDRVLRYLVKHYCGVSVRVFLYEINIWTGRLSETYYFSSCRWSLSHQFKTWKKQKGWPSHK